MARPSSSARPASSSRYRPNVDQQIVARHRAWLGLLQPDGLVVSAAALKEQGLVVDLALLPLRDRLVELQKRSSPGPIPFRTFAEELLGWRPKDLVAPAPELTVAVPEFPGDLLSPTLVLNDLEERPQLLIVELGSETPSSAGAPAASARKSPAESLPDNPMDRATDIPHRWSASPQSRLERLLRDTRVPLGVLYDGRLLRLTYAPRGETSGHLTFPIALLAQTDGRVLLGALQMLLGVYRLFPGDPEKEHLLALCKRSREVQNTVSTQLADQVLDALNELLQGFSRADLAQSDARLRTFTRTFELAPDTLDTAAYNSDGPPTAGPEHIYGGLLTTIMRLVFLLYAEERGLLPDDPLYLGGYSVRGLYERLREDHGRHTDAMDQRFGAWAQLVSLFRLVHNGVKSQAFDLPERQGELFDPDRYPYLEGRLAGAQQSAHAGRGLRGEPRAKLPRVPDGTVYRILDKLIMLEGERLSYRALAVEQIGSVYQNMMGFEVKRAPSPLMLLSAQSVSVELDDLLALPKKDRKKHLESLLKPQKVSNKVADGLLHADSLDALEAALSPLASRLGPSTFPAQSYYLEPTDERRRSGTHYTPQSLTGPIVQKTLEPLLDTLARSPRAKDGVPHPDDILDIKVCDPAMGSAAFLVEVCRQLGAALEVSWQKHGKPKIRRADGRLEDLDPTVETLIHAQRYVAERCVYGVDKNGFAVTLGKLSLWLATLARDRAFTFVDDSIRHGDSLVGLSRAQIGAFTWEVIGDGKGKTSETHPWVKEKVAKALTLREQIVKQQGSDDYTAKRRLLQDAEDEMRDVRLLGDAILASYFSGDNDRARKAERDRLAEVAMEVFGKNDRARLGELEAARASLRGGPRPIAPFHWEIEFPEVFQRENPGFDAFVGNPPFLGGTRISTANGLEYRDWLRAIHNSSSNSDLVAHFFRRAFLLARPFGTLGLVATNSISQGDTRSTGLTWICRNGGEIYHATRRLTWPGAAAVVVSVVHIIRGQHVGARHLNRELVTRISAYLLPGEVDDTPAVMLPNVGLSALGSYVLGIGFVFEDGNPKTTPLELMRNLIEKDPKNSERIFGYLGGEELNTSPTLSHSRFIIDFGEMSEPEARRYPDLLNIVEEKVKPARQHVAQRDRRELWWLHATRSPELRSFLAEHDRALLLSQVSSHLALGFVGQNVVVPHTCVVFLLDTYAAFAALQSRVHEVWALLNASSLEDRLRYTPTDCFETFPFPPGWQTDPGLEAAGKAYYEYRAELMVRLDLGLTKTYNRFHDEDDHDPDIETLRTLHAAMDRAMIQAYGWDPDTLDLECHFLAVHAGDDSEDNDTDSDGRKVKKRYRWSDETRDLILGRLLELNEQQSKPIAASNELSLTAPPNAAEKAPKKTRAKRSNA